MDEIFDALTIQETFDLSLTQLLIPADICDNYTVKRYRGGRFEFILKSTALSERVSVGSENISNIGPFECKLAPLQVDLTDVLSVLVVGANVTILI